MHSRIFLVLTFGFFVCIFSIQLDALTIPQIIENLRQLQGQVSLAASDEDARAYVRTYFRATGMNGCLGVDAISHENVGIKTVCTCCPSCTDPNFKQPCPAQCPAYYCEYPCGATRRCVACLFQIKDPRRVDLCFQIPSHAVCECAWPIMLVAEPFCHLGKCVHWFFMAGVTLGESAVNGCALCFPCWTDSLETTNTLVTKDEILQRIAQLIQQYIALESPVPEYESIEPYQNRGGRNHSRDDRNGGGYGTLITVQPSASAY